MSDADLTFASFPRTRVALLICRDSDMVHFLAIDIGLEER